MNLRGWSSEQYYPHLGGHWDGRILADSMRFFTGCTARLLPRLAACSATGAGLNLAHCGKHEDVQRFKKEAARTEQLKEATAWCKENNKRGYAAAHRLADDGEWFWPLVTEGSCNRRLDGRVNIDHPYGKRQLPRPCLPPKRPRRQPGHLLTHS